MKGKLLVIGALLMALVLAVACGGGAQPTSAPPTSAPAPAATQPPAAAPTTAPQGGTGGGGLSGTITIWTGYHTGDNEEKTINQLVGDAKKQFPNLTINVLEIPFDQLFNKFETEAATGGGPDMFIAPMTAWARKRARTCSPRWMTSSRASSMRSPSSRYRA